MDTYIAELGKDVNSGNFSRVTRSGPQGRVRYGIDSDFVEACGIKEAEFQNIDGVLDIWARPNINKVKPGQLLLVWAMPKV